MEEAGGEGGEGGEGEVDFEDESDEGVAEILRGGSVHLHPSTNLNYMRPLHIII